jgi:hypothetical protein
MRLARYSAACALVLTCTFAPAAMVQQQSSGSDSAPPSTAAKKSTTKKPATKSSTTTHKPTTHSSAAHSSVAKISPANSSTSSKRTPHKKTVRVRGQQKIDSERAEEIQQALIREHYLTGEASGTWNAASEEAMRRYQSDHGWQTKEVPDARALIKLGLGPSNDHLLNPESAMTSGPVQGSLQPKAASLTPASHSANPESHTSADPIPVTSSPATDTHSSTPSTPDPSHQQ